MLKRNLWMMMGWICVLALAVTVGCGDDDDDNDASGDCSLDCAAGETCEVVNGFPECVESQGNLDPGNSSSSSSSLVCPDLISCMSDCDGDDACNQGCVSRSSNATITVTDNFLSCVSSCSGTTEECVNGMCSSSYNACMQDDGTGSGASSELNCSEMFGCVNDCGPSSQQCVSQCGDQASQEAIEHYNDVVGCLNENCQGASDMNACMDNYCYLVVSWCEEQQN